MLLGFTVGKNAELIERISDDCVLEVISELIQRFFPYSKLPRPVKIIRFYYVLILLEKIINKKI